jgi:hypothetical protein
VAGQETARYCEVYCAVRPLDGQNPKIVRQAAREMPDKRDNREPDTMPCELPCRQLLFSSKCLARETAMTLPFDAPPCVTTMPAPPASVLNSPATGILQSIERRLRESSYYYLRTISAAHESGVITLRGRVPTFYLKQTVQAIVEKIEGVERVVNLVDVVNPAGVQ